jgi:hypothetical protein
MGSFNDFTLCSLRARRVLGKELIAKFSCSKSEINTLL